MKRTNSRSLARRAAHLSQHHAAVQALLALPIAFCAACAAQADASEIVEGVQQPCGPTTPQTASPGSCGYYIAANYLAPWKKPGFLGDIELTNVSGANAGAYELLVDLNGATMQNVLPGDATLRADGTYVVTSPAWLTSAALRPGVTLPIAFKSPGPYTSVTPYVLSINGVQCDQTSPTINLASSGSFFASAGTLTLTATASDDVAVRKVVFYRDGAEIATDTQPPYELAVPIADATNGRHRYTAAAFDPSGNSTTSNAQSVLVAVGNKFFGTAVESSVDYTKFADYFNQLTPGNGGKWGTVEATRDQMNWTKLDEAYQFAKQHGSRFKFHTLVWGQQQPGWVASLPADQQLAELEQWMSLVAARYPDIDMIDVVNEPLHAPPAYAAALGGAGTTGWDWVIKAFEMARAHFPKSELLLNDYNILIQPAYTNDYLKIVNLLKERGLIDGIGLQGHFLERADLSVVATDLNTIAASGLPIYISELDLNVANDARQAERMSQLFPIFWSNPSVVGVTHWGYIQGAMWQTDAYLLRSDGTRRPSLDWLVCYQAGRTDCTVPVYVPEPRVGDSSGITLQAEDYDSAKGLMAAGNMVAYASDGAWLSFSKVRFDDNWNTLNVNYAFGGSTPISLSVHLGSLDNAAIATVPLAPTGDWVTMKTVSIPWVPMSGEQEVFVRFHGGGANLDQFQFAAPAGTSKNLIADSDFEAGTNGSWWSWSAGTIANTTARSVSGTHSLAMTGRPGNSPLVQSLTSSVVPGKTYKASVWATIGGASSSAYVTTAIQCVGGQTQYGRLGGWSNSKTLTDGTWAEFGGDLVVPDCPLANVSIWLEGPDKDVDLYLDHVSVRQVSASNIVSNGTFESGTTGWFTWGGAALSATTARAHSGANSLLVANRTSNSPAAIDLTSVVQSGTSYPFSLWVSVHSPDGTAQAINVTQAASCKAADGTVSTAYNWIGGPVSVADGNSWVQLSGKVAVPNCTLSQLLFWVEGGAGADLYVDDVQVTDNGSGSSNLIQDGTFESGQGAWSGWGYTTLSLVSTQAHAGKQSLMGSGMQQYGAIARDIKALVTPGKRYQATAWVSVGNLAAGSGAVKWQTIQSCNSDTQVSYPWLAGATVNNGAWTQISGVVDLTACTSIHTLTLFAGADSGDLYVDDVTLTALP